MPIRVHCSCGQQYDLPDRMDGRKAKCKACGEVFLVNALDGEEILPGAEDAVYESSGDLPAVGQEDNPPSPGEPEDLDDEDDFEVVFSPPPEDESEETVDIPTPNDEETLLAQLEADVEAIPTNTEPVEEKPAPHTKSRRKSKSKPAAGTSSKTGPVRRKGTRRGAAAASRAGPSRAGRSRSKRGASGKTDRSGGRRSSRSPRPDHKEPVDAEAAVNKTLKILGLVLLLAAVGGIGTLIVRRALRPDRIPIQEWRPTPSNMFQSGNPVIHVDEHLNVPPDADAFLPFRLCDGATWDGFPTRAWIVTNPRTTQLKVVLYCEDQAMEKLNVSNKKNIVGNDSVEVFFARQRTGPYHQAVICADGRAEGLVYEDTFKRDADKTDWLKKRGVSLQVDAREDGVIYFLTLPVGAIGLKDLKEGVLMQVIRNFRGQGTDIAGAAVLMAFPNQAERPANHERKVWRRAKVVRTF